MTRRTFVLHLEVLRLEHVEQRLHERLVRVLHDGLHEPQRLQCHLLRARVRGGQQRDQALVHLHLELGVAVRQQLQQLPRVLLRSRTKCSYGTVQ